MRAPPADSAVKQVLVAPDSFKGTFTARQVARAIGRGLEAAGVRAELCPVADGGEGTMATLVAALGGRVSRAAVRDPLGLLVDAEYGLIEHGRTGSSRAIHRAGGLRGVRVHVICDVNTPFEHAAEVFGPQKGADSATDAGGRGRWESSR
jgi:glycerate kinase